MRPLTLVSGKGGVGKTTVSLALALQAARRRKKVLIVEVNSEEQVARLLGRPPIGYQEIALLPSLTAINIQPHKSFEEYVVSQLHSRLLYRAVFENRLVKNFVRGTPGLAELMTIGKICSLRERYDQIIVDAPSTGHCLALLQIAGIVASAVRVGPLGHHSAAIDALLKDSTQTGLLLVTLPEELPVTETLEMKEKLDSFPHLIEAIVLNQFVTSPLTAPERTEFQKNRPRDSDLTSQGMRLLLGRADRSRHYLKQLSSHRDGVSLWEIPFLFSASFGLEEVETVAEEIQQWT